MDDIQETRSVPVGLVALIAFAAGACLGYILGKRNGDVFEVPADALNPTFDSEKDENQLEMSYSEKSLETEASEIQQVYSGKVMGEVVTNIVVVETPEETSKVNVNVFTQHSPEWDFEYELKHRNPLTPYIISYEEFVESGSVENDEDEPVYNQETVTYYAKDDILADVMDTIIYDHKNKLGPLKFGHGSRDESTVYIRNCTLGMEWEVLLDEGAYGEEVLDIKYEGETEDIRHSVRKFRMED